MEKLIWLQGVTCNGNSHSFLNLEGLENFLKKFELLYHPLLPSKLSLPQLYNTQCDILVIEGGVKKGLKRGGVEFVKLFLSLAKRAKRVVAVGSCAVYGGVFKEGDNSITGVLFDKEEKTPFFKKLSGKVVNIPGCPAHPEWIAFGIEGKDFHLDEFYRPKELFAYTVHSGCSKNEYFEWKVDSKTFGEKEGCLFYELGCQAPYTRGSCNKMLWNGVSSKTRAGIPCIGCTESSFPKRELFKTKTYMGIPANMPLGVPKRAYLTLSGVAKSFKIERLSTKLF
ncbi:MAG: hydrogenase [Epsilonproteobacteria bacterium]|nr:hydrogenase [Campylobacterota bacterium]